MTSALERPPGQPEALYKAATKFGQLARDTTRRKDSVQQGVTTVLKTWQSPRAATFAQAAGDMSKRLDATARQLHIANQVISGYAGALAAAQAAIGQYAAQHARVGQDLRRAGQSAGEGPRHDLRLQHLSQRQGQIERQAEAVQTDLKTAAARAAKALDAAAEVRLKGAAGMSAEAILRRVTSAWSSIHELYRTFKEWSDPNRALVDLGEGYARTGMALEALNAWRAAEDANLLLRQTRNLEEAKAAAVATVHGAEDYRALRAWMQAQEVVSRYADDAARASRTAASAKQAFLDSVKLGGRLAKALAVVGVASGAYDLATPEHKGWRGVGDRAMGGIAVAAGGTQLAMWAGVLTLSGPVGPAVIGGALAATAAWTAGNFIWDHREQISHALETAGDWVGDRASDAGNWVGDRASDAAEGIAGGAKKVGSTIASGITSLF